TDKGIGPNERGPEGSRLQVCRVDDLLCIHASRRDGERPPDLLLPKQSACRQPRSTRATRRRPEMKSKSALDWLLEEDQPSVRYLTLTQLLERPLDDPAVAAATDMTRRKGRAHEIL